MGWITETKYLTKNLFNKRTSFTQFKGTSDHSHLRLPKHQERKEWWGRKSGILLTGWEQDMKQQKALGR
jgi:hypothetical protein